MKIGDANEFFSKIDKELLQKFQKQFGAIDRLLKPDDRFNFKCAQDGKCCTNRFGKDMIILTPYDVSRLCATLKINFAKFLEDYSYLILGSESQFPFVLLKYQETKLGNRCPFLDDHKCSVYKDRPLRCRLYPLGRVYSGGYSYFYLAQVGKECGITKGRQYTLAEWLAEWEIEKFCDWSDAIHELFINIDHKKYKKIALELKYFFGLLLYDFNIHNLNLPSDKLNHDEIMALTLDIAKSFLNKLGLLNKQQCLKKEAT